MIHEYPQQDFNEIKMPGTPDGAENAVSQDSPIRQLDSGDTSDSSLPLVSSDSNVSSQFLRKHVVQNCQSNTNVTDCCNQSDNRQESDGMLKEDEEEDNKYDNKGFQKIGAPDVNDNYVEHKSLMSKQIVCDPCSKGDVWKASSMEDQSPELSPNRMINDCESYPSSARLLYCQTCCKSVPSPETVSLDCDPHCTHNHVTVDFVEFVNSVHREAEDVMQQAWLGLDALTEDIENAKVSAVDLFA